MNFRKVRHLPNVYYVFCVRNWSGARVNSWSISFRQAAQVGPSFFLLSVSLPDPFCHRHPLGYTSSTQSPSSTPLSCPFRAHFARFSPTFKRSACEHTPTRSRTGSPAIHQQKAITTNREFEASLAAALQTNSNRLPISRILYCIGRAVIRLL